MRARRPGEVSLNRALSKLGIASRADARRLIAAGRVTVNERVTTDPAMSEVPERVRISVDGAAPAARRPPRRILLFHKPRGTVTTRRDPEGRRA